MRARAPRHEQREMEAARAEVGGAMPARADLDPPGRVATGRKAALRIAEAVERLRIATPAADAGRRDKRPQRDRGNVEVVSSHTGRKYVGLDPPGGDAKFEGGHREVTRALTSRTENDAGTVNVNLIEVDHVTAMRWSSSRGDETSADEWPAPPGSVADLPRPQSPTGVMDMSWHVDAPASDRRP